MNASAAIQKKRLLMVEDEVAICEMVTYAFLKTEFELCYVTDALAALSEIAQHPPLLVIIDWMLPGMSGLELLRRLRQNETTLVLPTLMLTARDQEMDKVKALDLGADDYLTKPFSTRELLARIRAILRRSALEEMKDTPFEMNGLRLDPVGHRVTANGIPLNIGPTEFKLLHFFISHPDRVYTRSQLLDHVWGQNVYIEERTVDVHIRRLRKVLSYQGHEHLVQTVRGAGYRFSAISTE